MSPNPVSSLGASTDQFLQLLIAQLQNQNPLEPVEGQEFIAQLATLQQVQGLNTLNASFDQMLKLQQLTQGTELIGKTVAYTPAGGAATSGTVDAVNLQNGQFVLQVGTDAVTLDQVSSVTA